MPMYNGVQFYGMASLASSKLYLALLGFDAGEICPDMIKQISVCNKLFGAPWAKASGW